MKKEEDSYKAYKCKFQELGGSCYILSDLEGCEDKFPSSKMESFWNTSQKNDSFKSIEHKGPAWTHHWKLYAEDMVWVKIRASLTWLPLFISS